MMVDSSIPLDLALARPRWYVYEGAVGVALTVPINAGVVGLLALVG